MRKLLHSIALLAFLSAFESAGAAAPESAEAAAAQPAPAAEHRNYFRRHMWHWITAFGVSYADNVYEDQVGYSTDPLLFEDPPGLDLWVRDGLMGEPITNFVLENRAEVGAVLTLGAAIWANLGEEGAGRRIADDVTGIVEVWFFDKGASGLVKNIIGRQRPVLEFIDDADLTPAEEAEEEAKRTNHQSFYSGSASRQFSLMSYADAIVAGRVKSRGARVASFLGFYGYAAYVGYSRIRNDDHYFTDVVAGAAAGIFIGRGFYKLHHRPGEPPHEDKPSTEPRVRLQSIAPVPGGAAVTLSIRM